MEAEKIFFQRISGREGSINKTTGNTLNLVKVCKNFFSKGLDRNEQIDLKESFFESLGKSGLGFD